MRIVESAAGLRVIASEIGGTGFEETVSNCPTCFFEDPVNFRSLLDSLAAERRDKRIDESDSSTMAAQSEQLLAQMLEA